MRRTLVQRLSAAGDDATALRSFLRFFPNDEVAQQARLRLAQLAQGELTLSQEFVLRRLAHSGEPSLAVFVNDALARGYARAGRRELAQWHAEQLASRWAQAAAPNGQTGAQLAKALTQSGDANLAPSAWPRGDVKATPSGGPGLFTNTYPIRVARDLSFDPGRVSLTMDLQSRVVQGFGGFGQRLFAVELPPRVGSFYTSYYFNKAWIAGSLLVVSTGDQLVGIDTLGGEGDAGARIIWTRSLIDGVGSKTRRGVASRTMTLPWGATMFEAVSMGQFQLSHVDMVGDDMMFLATGSQILAMDALTGETAWIRDYPSNDVSMFGDRRRLYVVGRNSQQAVVLNRDSGQEIGQRKIPSFNTRMAEQDGRVLVWEGVNGATRLRLFDLWEQRNVWSKDFAAGAKGEVAGDIVALMTPRGECVLLKTDTGETLNRIEFDPVKKLDRVFLHRAGDRIVAVAADSSSNTGARRVYPLSGNTTFNPVFNGIAYGFDARTGKAVWTRKVERQALITRQPAALPLLTFAVRVDDRDPKTRQRTGYHVELLCLDDRDGRELYHGELPNSSSAMDVVGDPQHATVELRTHVNSVRLKWTKE